MMQKLRHCVLLILLLLLPGSAAPLHGQSPTPSLASMATRFEPLLAAPRWWDDTVQWLRGLGWDRGRLVQIWLFFMLVGLYIILRIKPRA